MADLTEHYARTVSRAKAVLKKGDKVRMYNHGSVATYTFDHWDEDTPNAAYFVSKSGIDELHPWNVFRINGVDHSFRDGG